MNKGGQPLTQSAPVRQLHPANAAPPAQLHRSEITQPRRAPPFKSPDSLVRLDVRVHAHPGVVPQGRRPAVILLGHGLLQGWGWG
jgi:hypothetical protein